MLARAFSFLFILIGVAGRWPRIIRNPLGIEALHGIGDRAELGLGVSDFLDDVHRACPFRKIFVQTAFFRQKMLFLK